MSQASTVPRQRSSWAASSLARGTFRRIHSNLGPEKVGVQHQAGLLPNSIGEALRFQLLAARRRAAALPYDGVTQRLAGRALPGNSSLPLIGDPKRRNLNGRNTGLF